MVYRACMLLLLLLAAGCWVLLLLLLLLCCTAEQQQQQQQQQHACSVHHGPAWSCSTKFKYLVEILKFYSCVPGTGFVLNLYMSQLYGNNPPCIV